MIQTDLFLQALNVVVQYVCTDDTRPQFKFVFFEFQDEDVLRIIATSGATLASIELSVPHGQPGGTMFLLYTEYAKQLLGALKGRTDELMVYLAGGGIMFICGVDVHTYPGPEIPGEIPGFGTVLNDVPAGHTGAGWYDANYVSDALTRCKPLMRSEYPCFELRVADNKPLYIMPETTNPAVISVTIVIMYKRSL